MRRKRRPFPTAIVLTLWCAARTLVVDALAVSANLILAKIQRSERGHDRRGGALD